MFKLTEKLLAGSGVTPATHPVLVSLLELAAQRPGIKGAQPVPDIVALRKRVERQWHRVCDAFRACVAVGVTDADLVALECDGLRYTVADGWRIMAADLMQYRVLVAAALHKLAVSKSGAEQFAIASIDDLRAAQKRNGVMSFSAPVHGHAGRVETKLLDGRGVIVSWPLFGLRVFSALVADEFGRVRAVAHRPSKKAALESFNLKTTP